ncbi:RNA polymerase sigma factor [Paenibacillus sp. NAIST15-1]|uniref:RNA polymerase sigma factor n=1 Tax=Paenibacillus sp. NAIST15-1 TaxID=1605994 RepID=UPI00086C56EC|nr:sigma-70 family RNA polymerase sigma factor [Paenibacillus sp. NAIST15-1]GAV13129.1 RNA polymerase sigma factor [Paenibacillus sp. NAIST15-1]
MNTSIDQIQQLVLAGDERVYTKLYIEYRSLLVQHAYRYVRNQQDAEDVVQEAYIRIFRNLHRYNFSCKICSWMKLIVKNLCIDLIRQRSRKPAVHFTENIAYDNQEQALIETLQDQTQGPEQQILEQEVQHNVINIVNEMPDAYRDVFRLRYLSEYSLAEISNVLSLEINTVKSRLFRGKKYLRKQVDSGDICS